MACPSIKIQPTWKSWWRRTDVEFNRTNNKSIKTLSLQCIPTSGFLSLPFKHHTKAKLSIRKPEGVAETVPSLSPFLGFLSENRPWTLLSIAFLEQANTYVCSSFVWFSRQTVQKRSNTWDYNLICPANPKQRISGLSPVFVWSWASSMIFRRLSWPEIGFYSSESVTNPSWIQKLLSSPDS